MLVDQMNRGEWCWEFKIRLNTKNYNPNIKNNKNNMDTFWCIKSHKENRGNNTWVSLPQYQSSWEADITDVQKKLDFFI